jgi:hypothetical protein
MFIIVSLLTLSSVGAQQPSEDPLYGDPSQPGYTIHKLIITKFETDAVANDATEQVIQDVIQGKHTDISDNYVLALLANDMTLTSQFFHEIITSNSLIEVTKQLIQGSPEKYEHIIALAFSLYPDYQDDIFDGAVLSQVVENEDVIIAFIIAGADPSTVSLPTASGGDPDPVTDIIVGSDGSAGNDRSSGSDYDVILGVTEKMAFPSTSGQLRVWIGGAGLNANFPARLVQQAKSLFVSPDIVAAEVLPYAPDFDISPSEALCMKLDPSGSEVRFELIPKKTGTFFVGAEVYLFTTDDCSDSPIPKTAADLEVTVNVSVSGLIDEGTGEMGSVLWEKFISFWGALVALFFGLILFLIRGKKLKKCSGFQKNRIKYKKGAYFKRCELY